MSFYPTGQQFTIRNISSKAIITEIGAHLREFLVNDEHIIVPFEIDALPTASNGAVLIPWPNRLRDGQYSFNGEQLHVPITEVDRQTALHGLAFDKPWQVLSHTESAITLELTLQDEPGYPFHISSQVTYELTDAGELTITTSTRNAGTAPAPYGVGFHPWLAPGAGGLDAATFELKVGKWMETDDRLLPVQWQPVPQVHDYSQPRNLADSDLDDAFGDPEYDAQGISRAVLTRADGYTVQVWADASLPYWQVCTGNHVATLRRQGIAVEPMSCIADAFRTKEDLIELAPGDEHVSVWGISVSS